jgi:hypothetical protein
MIRSTIELKGYDIVAFDGKFGKVSDLLFDEVLWITRYLVADTGGWLSGRRLLLPPSVLDQPEWKDRTMPVKLKKEEIENSPPLDEDAPVSRQHEIQLHRYWNLEPYWVGGILAGVYPIPQRPHETGDDEAGPYKGEDADPYLRSVNEVRGYGINAEDGEIGKVDDFLIDDDSWVIRYLVVDTRKWLPGRRVLVPLVWIKSTEWSTKSIGVDVIREKVKNSPDFDPSVPINSEQEEILYDYYGRPRYWATK